jgi:PHS family inorganic phosphate transporter-like MFS transporter
MGFFILTILFLVLGIGYEPIKKTSIILFIVIFTLMQFFLNFGPNATTFVIPGEVFPTRYRSTAHGKSLF